ncbi:VWA domain-containing protein [Aliiglaciecola sp. LCG003]|uniref:vWA domain-containing protein n=1 Tax=Aliiglaciecola sp. LCG003 TaxID=3053655 RepID=UPI0025741852|nr:VWA domain-containing protein [Aliiglaciecola sp. LCG003]WJG10807.1 VWA domain-containing protein [Aliiglaciecola sp. LCG003]
MCNPLSIYSPQKSTLMDTTDRWQAAALAAIFSFALGGCSSPASQTSSEQAHTKQAIEADQIQAGGSRMQAQPVMHDKAKMNHRLAVEFMPLNAAMADYSVGQQRPNLENYQHYAQNKVQKVAEQPVSTFSIDVDSGSYSNARRMINQGYMPPSDAIRVEEFINYFDYHYPMDQDPEKPFTVATYLTVSPWNPGRLLMRIGLQAKQPAENQMARADKNLVFLLDVSGSMNSANKLPLVKKALTLLTGQLLSTDRVAIVVYAGASGVVLEPTAGNDKVKIEQALAKLSAGGSTNGGQGIELAYDLAAQSFKKDGVNRVILATDGDFNVGRVDHQQLIDLIERKREQGIALTTLGFGQGNYNDHLMEQLANKGNGNYAYIDTLNEARKVLVDELDATLHSVARDVKIQVEFNPANVSEYRLIGYENRVLQQEDFNNDKVDAGEIGAGHQVTAFYELVLADGDKYHDPLRYQNAQTGANESGLLNELALVKLRYKPLDNESSVLLQYPIEKNSSVAYEQQSVDFKFATAVIGFAQQLKNSHYNENMNYQQILELAINNKGQDEFGYRAEFIGLIRMVMLLQHN